MRHEILMRWFYKSYVIEWAIYWSPWIGIYCWHNKNISQTTTAATSADETWNVPLYDDNECERDLWMWNRYLIIFESLRK